jgi:ADP-ribose pyrophosphatase YjhB (NUDIX family)
VFPSSTDVSALIRARALNLLAVAQNGLAYVQDPFDYQRYDEVRRCAEELMNIVSDCELPELHEFIVGDSGYMTPKVSVRGALFNSSDQVLLVQERADELWALPGGWCDVLHSPSQAVVKELREEAGIIVRVEKLVAVLDRDRLRHPSLFHVYQMLFLCHEKYRVRPEITETIATGWFAVDALPPLSPTVLKEDIDLVYRHWLNPALPAVFD